MVQKARASIPYGRVVFNDWLRLHRFSLDQLRPGAHHRVAFAMAIYVLGRWGHNSPVGVCDPVHDASRSHPGQAIQ